MSDAPRDEQYEFSEFLFGAKNNPDGTTPSDAEERRRMEALPAHIKALAKKHGLEVNSETNRPAHPAAPTARAAEIRQIAESLMSKADDRVRTSIEHAKVELPDGTKIQRTQILLGCIDTLSDAVKGLLNPGWIGKLASKSLSVFVKVGGWGMAKIGARDPSDSGVIVEGKEHAVEDDEFVKSE